MGCYRGNFEKMFLYGSERLGVSTPKIVTTVNEAFIEVSWRYKVTGNELDRIIIAAIVTQAVDASGADAALDVKDRRKQEIGATHEVAVFIGSIIAAPLYDKTVTAERSKDFRVQALVLAFALDFLIGSLSDMTCGAFDFVRPHLLLADHTA